MGRVSLYRQKWFRGSCSVLSLLLMLLSGCGGGKRSYSVGGTITLDGKPLPAARVTFVPVDDAGTAAVAITNAEGKYILGQAFEQEGAAAASYRVTITTAREADELAEPAVPAIPEQVPKRYNVNSELTAEISPQATVLDFALTRKP